VTVLRTVAALSAVAIAMTFAPGASGQGLAGSAQVDLNQAVPAIEVGGVTVLGPGTAIVRTGVGPGNLLTRVHVEYGETTLLGQSTPAVSVVAGGDPVKLLQELSGLKPGTSYYYRVVAENSLGTTTTTTGTFRTAPETRVDPATGMPTTSGKGVSCTITGTAKADKLRGTSKKDVICGLGGSDRMNGGKGNDTIIGGSGNDRIDGGAGKDKLLGNGGKDVLKGSSGGDRIDGGKGNDRLTGNAGKDRLAGGAGNDRITANRDKKGGDRVNGGKGRDRATVNRGDRVSKTERVTKTGGKARKHKRH
jgi:Ca2+-binding RTX toxin-like protein